MAYRSPEAKQLAAQVERTGHVLATTADFAARKIFLFGSIDDSAAYRLAVALTVMDGTPGPITIMMNTEGGHIESGYAIFDCIRACRNTVTIVGLGSVMSMGAIIMQAADMRLMAPRARMMIHTGNVGFDGELDSDKLISIGGEMDGIRDRFVSILAERADISEKEVRQLVVQETYMSAEEALDRGFIDGVLVMPEKEPAELEKTQRKASKARRRAR